ncbi:hypothetical protein E2562_001892 [Oryza meyeriana var. granulata]|uniref:Uncharacterized protein n=1 Tax=Oryza meyeriana var. granulata TaxID=110450 RepID=A0A6G1C340_9ORYZ|nr:hypothetical protein E2562_001892 [Oryza meyeriana var. granulata]
MRRPATARQAAAALVVIPALSPAILSVTSDVARSSLACHCRPHRCAAPAPPRSFCCNRCRRLLSASALCHQPVAVGAASSSPSPQLHANLATAASRRSPVVVEAHRRRCPVPVPSSLAEPTWMALLGCSAIFGGRSNKNGCG